MRTRINNITFTPGTRSIITGITDLTIDDIRLFINESQMKVICSSMQKDNIDSISSGVVTYKDTFPVLAVGDHITFEIDKGDNGAKEANATANKNAIINAINNIDLSTVAKESAATANKEAIIAAINSAEPDLSSVAKETSVKSGNDTVIAVTKAIQDAVGSAPSGSEITTLFAWLTTIYEYLAGQTPEEIPEGLGDRINLLLQFFGLPQALTEYQSMPLLEMTGILEDIMITIDPDLTAEEAAAITEEVLSR